jgi:hypothetical protein
VTDVLYEITVRAQGAEAQNLDSLRVELFERREIGRGCLTDVEPDQSPGRKPDGAPGIANALPSIVSADGSQIVLVGVQHVDDPHRAVIGEADHSADGRATSVSTARVLGGLPLTLREHPGGGRCEGTDGQEDQRGGLAVRVEHGLNRGVGPGDCTGRGRRRCQVIEREISHRAADGRLKQCARDRGAGHLIEETGRERTRGQRDAAPHQT